MNSEVISAGKEEMDLVSSTFILGFIVLVILVLLDQKKDEERKREEERMKEKERKMNEKYEQEGKSAR